VHNRWTAARFGPAAELLHPDGEQVLPASALGRELLELVRPHAVRLGGGAELAALDPRHSEAELQLAFTAPAEAAADLVARTLR
jgi:gamma-glutamyl:cysteine ligase YbdK (ATP-grasp superfamily)